MIGIRKELLFLMKFFLIYFLLQAAIQLSPLQPLQEFIAGIEAAMLGLENVGNTINTINGLFVINASCTGLVSASVLAAVIFALKKPDLKMKAALFIAGAIALFLLNLARVYLVLLVAVNIGAEAAEIAHTVSWFSTAAFILVLWYIGVKRVAGIKNFGELM